MGRLTVLPYLEYCDKIGTKVCKYLVVIMIVILYIVGVGIYFGCKKVKSWVVRSKHVHRRKAR